MFCGAQNIRTFAQIYPPEGIVQKKSGRYLREILQIIRLAMKRTFYPVGCSLLFCALVLLIGNPLLGQSCFPSGITFRHQTQIDDFATNYPGCTTIEGNVTIDNSIAPNITNLDGLSQITTINGNLIIESNYYLTSITGLSNLTTVGGNLDILDNNILPSFNGLNNLETVGGRVYLRNNNTLMDFSGFDKLESIGNILRIWGGNDLTSLDGFISLVSIGAPLEVRFHTDLVNFGSFPVLNSVGGITIRDNDELTNLDGIESITTCTSSVQVRDNPKITQINALSNISTIGRYLYLISNPLLSDISGLQNLVTIENDVTISNCYALTNFDALSKLTTIKGGLYILGNTALTSLSGLSNLTTVLEDVQVTSNFMLTDLAGLDNIDYTQITGLNIINNSLLNTCDVASICGFLGIAPGTATIYIYDNLANCNSKSAILTDCTTNWGAADDGSWDEGGNWAEGMPPSATSPAIVDGDVVVTIAGNAEALSLSLANGAELVINGNLTVPDINDIVVPPGSKISGSGTINGDIQVDGGNFCTGNSPGQMIVNGTIELTSGTYDVEIDGLNPGTGYDQLSASGQVTINSNVQLNLIFGDGFEPSETDFFDIITSGGISGSFNEGNITFSGGNVESILVSYPDANTVRIMVIPSAPLPVTWLDVDIHEQEGQNHLSWSTATEVNNRGFFVERSGDGVSWVELGFVSGSGTTYGEIATYEWVDRLPPPGQNYYRLRQEDLDGKFDFSEVVTIRNQSIHQVRIYPNPFSESLQIEWPVHEATESRRARLYDMTGRLLWQRTLSGEKQQLDLSDQLSPGIYWMELEQAGTTIRRKLHYLP